MKLHCIEDIINGQQAFMPSGLVATLSVCPDNKTVTVQYQDGLEVITDMMSYDAFNELIQDGVEMLRDDLPMPLRVMESNMNKAFTYIGNIELELPDEIVKSIAVSGDNEVAVEEALNNKDVQEQLAKFTDDELKQAVEEYGVELDSPDRHTLEQYAIWLAAWNIADSDEDDLVESLLHEDHLDDELNSELKTPFSREEFVDAAVKQLNTAIVDILEYADTNDLYQTLADKYGYKYYDDALMFDVKYRPNLHITAEDIGVDEDTFYNELNSQIESLAEDLHYEHPDFRIYGRSGGYWGFLVELKDLVITKAYAEKFVDDMLDNEEFMDWLYSPDADGTAVNDAVWSYIWNYTEYDILCDDVVSSPLENLDLSDEFKEKMNNLAETIDSTEKAMDSVDYWKDLFSEEEFSEEDFAESIERKKLMKNDNIVESLLKEDYLSDEDIATQYNDFKCTYLKIKKGHPSVENWYNFTLELEFPEADHPDFSDYVIENGYYNKDDDVWGFDNWYPSETLESLKALVLKEIDNMEARGLTEIETDMQPEQLALKYESLNNSIAEGLLNEISDEVVNKTTGRRASDFIQAKMDGDVEKEDKAREKLKKNLDLVKKRDERKSGEDEDKDEKLSESVITEEDLNDLLSMSGERYTDISDLDMPEPLAASVPTTENGEPITLELLYKAISDLTASMTELATAIKQPKIELQPLENPMGQPAPKEEIEVEQEIAEEPATEESEEDDEADKEKDDKESDKKTDKDDSEDLDELDKEIEDELKDDKKEKKNEDLAKAKEEIDKAIEDKKSPEEIDATIDYMTDNEYDKKAADEYKVQKMKEAFRNIRHNSLLERLKWGR